MIQKLLLKITVIILSVTLLSACEQKTNTNKGKSSDNQEYQGTIKVGHLVALDMAPLFIAKEKGFFKEQGLDVETVFFSNPGDNNAALAGGNIQFSVNPFTLPFLADNAGTPMKIISSAGGLGIIEVVAQGSLKVDSIATLKAKVTSQKKKIKVGSLRGDTLDMILYKAFQEQGLTYDDFEMVWFNDLLAMVLAFQSGQIDILSHIKPYTTDLVVNYGAKSLTNNSDVWGYGTPNCTTAVMEDFLKQHPITVQKYLTALQEAFDFIVANPEEAALLLEKGKYYKVSQEVLEFALKNQPKDSNIYPNIDGMFIALNDMIKQGYIKKADRTVVQTHILETLSKNE